MTDTFRLTKKTDRTDKRNAVWKACLKCPYEHRFCDELATCPALHDITARLALYEDVMDINELYRMMNKKTLKNLPVKPETEGVWIYRSHLGGELFTTTEPLDFEQLICEECGDSDDELGYFENLPDAFDGCAYDDEDIGTFYALMHIFYPSVTLYQTDYETCYEDPESEDDEEEIPEALDVKMMHKALKRLRGGQ